MATTRPQFRRISSPMIAPTMIGQTATRDISRLNAHTLKVTGGGSTGTGGRQSKVGDLGETIGGILGGNTGGTIGRIGGEVIDTLFGGNDRPTARPTGLTAGGTGTCPEGTRNVLGRCVDLGALPPGGDPAIVPMGGTGVGNPGGTAVAGAFGMPAKTPRVEVRYVRSCGPGMVLGKDNLCYPKAVLRRNSKFRKHRSAPKPPVTAADMRAIRRAESVRGDVKDLAKAVGLKTRR